MKISNRIKVFVLAATVFFAGALSAGTAFAFDPAYECEHDGHGTWNANVGTCVMGPNNNVSLWKTINGIINWVLGIVGVIAVVMIIIGGIMYSTSAGDAPKVKKAKDTILYGIIGLIISLVAAAIVNFVLNNIFTDSSTDPKASAKTLQECTDAGGTWDAVNSKCN